MFYIKKTVLEFQFRSVKYTVVTRLRQSFEQLFIPIQAIQGIRVCDVNNPPQKVFKHGYTMYIIIQIIR